MRIGAIYDFCKRGGDYVMINMLQALSSDGHHLDLITTNPDGIEEAFRFFGVRQKIDGLKIKSIRVPPFLSHPYSVAYIARKVEKRYDLLLLSDDIPRRVEKPVLSYFHYPHAARIKLDSLVENRYKRSMKGRLKWRFHSWIFDLFFLTERVEGDKVCLANSTLTRRHLLRTLNPQNLHLVYPPVASQKIYDVFQSSAKEKENMAVAISKFKEGKKLEELVYAAYKIKDKMDLKFRIVGAMDDRKVFRWLSNLVETLGVEDIVEFKPNADRKTVLNSLINSRFLIHPSPHEPFGMAVVEGMAAGCIPVVKKGLNGPWMDITRKGRYGIGFDNPSNLAKVLLRAITNSRNLKRTEIMNRALEFDEKNFHKRFLAALKPYLK